MASRATAGRSLECGVSTPLLQRWSTKTRRFAEGDLSPLLMNATFTPADMSRPPPAVAPLWIGPLVVDPPAEFHEVVERYFPQA